MAIVANKRTAMILYSGETCPYSHRIRMILAEKGVTVDIVNVDPHDLPEALLEINPYGTIPTLVDRGDLVLYDAGIIMEYLDERFPHPPLLPVYPVARAKHRLIIYRIKNDWYSLMNTILESKNQATIEKARKELTESLLGVLPVFKEYPYFMSEEFSLIDCCLAPLMWRLPQLGIQLPPTAKAIHQYAERLFDRDSFLASLTEAERELCVETA